jgi:hypothetical protein
MLVLFFARTMFGLIPRIIQEPLALKRTFDWRLRSITRMPTQSVSTRREMSSEAIPRSTWDPSNKCCKNAPRRNSSNWWVNVSKSNQNAGITIIPNCECRCHPLPCTSIRWIHPNMVLFMVWVVQPAATPAQPLEVVVVQGANPPAQFEVQVRVL